MCVDIAGNGPGKENLPPLTAAMSRDKVHNVSQCRARRVSLLGSASRCAANPSDVLPFSDSSHASREQSTSTAKLGFSKDEPKEGSQPFGKSVITREWNSILNKRNALYYNTTWKAPVEPHISSSISQLPTTVIAPVLRKIASSKKQKHPILHEDVERPEMFEDAWLNDQEATVAQCVNDLFEKMNNRNCATDLGHAHLRRTLLKIYQGAECSLLNTRLKASLLYGCLGRSKESLDASPWQSDIGIRQKFVSLWAGSYSLDMLSAAAEVVAGREALFDSPFPGSRHQCDDAHTKKTCKKKNLKFFLESCLLRNGDAPDAEQSSPAWCWRRTMLRSMMVIYLLDKAKQMHIISTNLYQASSAVKSSLAFLRELTALIHPSVGDIYRLLKPLGYHVHYTQYPLSEFSYCIENLATDLRDGVRLTRLVELLLYPLGSRTVLEKDVTIAMPAGVVLTTTLEEGHSWVFSQHLKFPCTARAQKIYNVQVALGALRAVHGVNQISESLSAEEIVDGHRESTMTLLWAMLGNWGLESFVNSDELRKEIRRLRKADGSMSDDESDVEGDHSRMREGSQEVAHLLRVWSRSIARRNGLRVLNLTTSFAVGRIFAGILDEYLPYLSGTVAIGSSGKQCQLDARLRAIGCSTSFGKSFTGQEKVTVC